MILQDFDILFCSRDTKLSKAIQTVTNSEFSHTAHVRSHKGKLYVLDAQIDGYQMKPFDAWKEKYNYDFIAMRLDGLNHAECLAREIEIVGKGYDFESLAFRQPKRLITRLLNKFRKVQKDDWNERENELTRVYCSEGTAYVIGLPEIQLTPKEVFHEVTMRGGKVVK